MTTALFLLRCLEVGLSIKDMDELTVGMVNDMFIEKNNDSYEWKEIASQEDMDRF
jgi:hypothetical protein